jgi:hypothetical protein
MTTSRTSIFARGFALSGTRRTNLRSGFRVGQFRRWRYPIPSVAAGFVLDTVTSPTGGAADCACIIASAWLCFSRASAAM